MSKFDTRFFNSLDYKDVFIIPRLSRISSRKDVDTSVQLFNFKLDVPVISANMDTVTDGIMALAMAKAGAIGAIHRFMSIEDNIKEFNIVKDGGFKDKKIYNCLVSVGVNGDSKERVQALYDEGARYFIIDVAHGDSEQVAEMIEWIKAEYDCYVMAGNVATTDGAMTLKSAGADAIKAGVGPGAVCLTKNVTGVTVPQFTAVLACSEVKNPYDEDEDIILVADGGITEIGDICKALGAGADLVMAGRMFAVCEESCGPKFNGKKVYRGMASKDAMLKIRSEDNLPTPEGTSIVLTEDTQTVEQVVKHVKGGIQSSFSYCDAQNLKEFQRYCRFGTRSR